MTAPLPDFIRFGRAVCGDLAPAERREWWLANGLGAYAAGTIAGTLTRRYHGLLIAPVRPPLGRLLVFAKADATLHDGAESWPLFTNRWSSGVVEPAGHIHMESFRLEGRLPVWRYALGPHRLEVRIWLEHGENTVHLAYRLEGPRAVTLAVRLLVNARDHHGETEAGRFTPRIETEGQALRVELPNLFSLHFRTDGAIHPADFWICDFDLPAERERGLSDRDNHLCAGKALITLTPNRWAGLTASLEARPPQKTESAMARALARERTLLTDTKTRVPALERAPQWVDQLVLAADSFFFARPLPDMAKGESVIAGYPWFGDWGRDTMIALPGLALATGNLASAHCIIETFARFIDRGMLPNVFPGDGQVPQYNSADASLWYIEAWRAYLDASDDENALRTVFPKLQEVLECYRCGTRYGVRMDPVDALLHAGEPGIQLTWMDAKVGNWVVTPRTGKPVEVNALWYSAHCVMAEFAARLDEPADKHLRLAEAIRDGFRRFKNPSGGLYDVLDGPEGDDPSLRPNQLLAVSLHHSPLRPADQAEVLRRCEEALCTSYGLRSLCPQDPTYRPRYTGGVRERDGAYHQGTVWGWLLGHYALATYRVTGDPEAAQRLLEPIRDHLLDAGLGSVSEIFDGAPPHLPRGAPCQAWSVACILEAWWRLERAKSGVCHD